MITIYRKDGKPMRWYDYAMLAVFPPLALALLAAAWGW